MGDFSDLRKDIVALGCVLVAVVLIMGAALKLAFNQDSHAQTDTLTTASSTP